MTIDSYGRPVCNCDDCFFVQISIHTLRAYGLLRPAGSFDCRPFSNREVALCSIVLGFRFYRLCLFL